MCEDQYYYVGETTQLFTRLRKHENLNGGVNTETLIPITIVGLYRVDSICKFIEYRDYIKSKKNPQRVNYYLENFENSFEYDSKYDNLLAEQFVTERLMISAEENWEKIRGGKYTRFDIDYDFPEDELFTIDLPICNCGMPCDIRKKKGHNCLYFRCSKKNMWDELLDIFETSYEPCNFYKEYKDDEIIKNEFNQRKSKLKDLYHKSTWLCNVETHVDFQQELCVGGCGETSSGNKLKYNSSKINLCFDCFIHKNKELCEKYKPSFQCVSFNECLL
tara:strand:+ start:1021 stop:1848 length:828 start_codon:yes stop_codon:yes gene_type:complete